MGLLKGLLVDLGRAAAGKLVTVALEEAANRMSTQTRDRIAAEVSRVALLAIDVSSRGFEERLAEAERRGYERGRTGK